MTWQAWTGTAASPSQSIPSGATLYTGVASQLNHNWGTGAVLNTNTVNGVEALFSGYMIWPGPKGVQSTVNFKSSNDDGFVLTLNGTTIINSWYDQAASTYNGYGSFTGYGGTIYPMTVWYYENASSAKLVLNWDYGGGTSVVPASYFEHLQ